MTPGGRRGRGSSSDAVGGDDEVHLEVPEALVADHDAERHAGGGGDAPAVARDVRMHPPRTDRPGSWLARTSTLPSAPSTTCTISRGPGLGRRCRRSSRQRRAARPRQPRARRRRAPPASRPRRGRACRAVAGQAGLGQVHDLRAQATGLLHGDDGGGHGLGERRREYVCRVTPARFESSNTGTELLRAPR